MHSQIRALPKTAILVAIGFFSGCAAVAADDVAADRAASAASRPTTVKVAAVQCSSVLGDVEGNRRKLTALVTEAAGAGAKIIVLPEAAVTGYLSQDLKTNWRLPGKPIDR
ncbi:MAG TPA: nitrilase-related carbon-nitrogen hydrolase, partial [Pirellulales bacterium]|nr:nitrilase-related carbon-nitrogen hydrolase [Pirellulales bacterium]